ncbi:Histidine-containing phosphotransfer protein [Thalictrum thalictroides]|uniref:Histidine-containing phosphotransfer protein n=1 Tax=Thalictrum thalictroides TaxID=46969 RepID=A0A7J6WJ26_THATH|nr:Histidine-containing phosphotransfer protein [Thalictrum thalictroides]
MSTLAIQQELNRIIADMRKEKITDSQFDDLQSLQDPAFLIEIITIFCGTAPMLFNEIDKQLKQPVVNYEMIRDHVHQLKGCSSSIGAGQVTRYCMDFNKAFEQGSLQGVIDALNKAYNEFFRVREKFDQVVQLGQKLLITMPNRSDERSN